MPAFVEHLCEHAVIVRQGPRALKYSDPFDYAICGVRDGEKLIIKALVVWPGPWWLRWMVRPWLMSHAKECIAVIRDELQLDPTWERFKGE